jgi:TrmH family RNA methyltransferase
MINITSLQNPKVKELIALREGRERRRSSLFVIEGAREIERAIQGGFSCRTFYIESSVLSPESRALADQLPENIKFGIHKDVFARVAVREGSDGVLAVMEYKTASFEALRIEGSAFLLVLENLEKPGNFGALARSADGAGVDGIVVLDPKADLYNPHAIRASVGALFSRPIITSTHEEFLDYTQRRGIKIVAATPHAKKFHYQADLKSPLALVLGSEAWGLSGAWEEAEPIKIPMRGIADSLNVSVAGAVIMYEILRQRS